MHPAPRGKLLGRRGRPIRNLLQHSLRRAVDPCRHRTACASRSPEIRFALLLHLRRRLPSCIMLAPLMYFCCPRQPHDDNACTNCTCSSAPHQFLVAALCSVPKLSGVRPALSPAPFVLECFNLFHSHFTFPCFSVNTVCWHAVVQECQRQACSGAAGKPGRSKASAGCNAQTSFWVVLLRSLAVSDFFTAPASLQKPAPQVRASAQKRSPCSTASKARVDTDGSKAWAAMQQQSDRVRRLPPEVNRQAGLCMWALVSCNL